MLAPLDAMIIRAGHTEAQAGWISTGSYGIDLEVVDDSPAMSTAGPFTGEATPDFVNSGSQANVSVAITIPASVSQTGSPYQVLRPDVHGYYEVPSSVECDERFQVCVKPTTGQLNTLDGWYGSFAQWEMEVLPTTADFDGRMVAENPATAVYLDECWAAMVAANLEPSCDPYHITGGDWLLDPGNTTDGLDSTGWAAACIDEYRSNGFAPCSAQSTQPMVINCADAGVVSKYDTDGISVRITSTEICAQKTGAAESCITY